MLTYRQAKREFERAYVRELMEEAGNSPSKAAEIAQLNRTHLYIVMKRSGLHPPHTQNRGNAYYIQLGR